MTLTQRSVSKNWFKSSFDALYPLVYANRTVAAALEESRFAVEITGLQANEMALDLACGNGRHMVYLREQGLQVCGLDFSVDLLQEARRTLGQDALLARGDMRTLPFVEQFDVVFNFFTSFGYFQDESENRRVARNIAQALKPEGRFFIDHMNARQVRATLVPRSTREASGYRIEERRWIDETAHRVNKTTQVFRDDEEVAHYEESVRLYEVEEICEMLGAVGLECEAVYGDYSGKPQEAEDPRMILVGRKRPHHG